MYDYTQVRYDHDILLDRPRYQRHKQNLKCHNYCEIMQTNWMLQGKSCD